ncbi:MAG: substrate-binding periplasmic protein [Rheinheimera sp.]
MARLIAHALLVVIGIFATVLYAEPLAIKYPAVATLSDFRSEYPIALLQLALNKAEVKAELQPSAEPMSKSRALHLLNTDGGIDVVWTMTSKERELQYLPIRIPIYRGLGSYRLLLIKNSDQTKFSQLKNQKELQQLRFAQVHDWVDTEILRASRFSILAVSKYENLFRMLLKDRVDAIPRGVLEIEAEHQTWQQQGLTIESKWLIHYPGAVYYFVKQDNFKLAAEIERGLRTAIADGSFQELFEQFFQKHLDQMALDQRIVIELPNPFLPPTTPLNDPSLWFKPVTQ